MINRVGVLCGVLCVWLSHSPVFAQVAEDRSETAIPESYTLEASADGSRSVLVHSKSKVRFVWIPGGQYTIGTDEYADSKRIQVSLQPYWIGESPLSCVQVASIMESLFASLNGELVPDRMFRYGRLPRLDGMDEVYGEYYGLFDLYLKQDPGFELAAKKTLGEFEKGYLTALRSLGDAEFDLADFELAEELGNTIECQLPTEAQWEAAVPRVSSKITEPQRRDMLYEWCSDFYSFDAFQVMAGACDPIGPRYGKLTPEQLEKAVASSAPPFRAAWMARRLHVLRSVSDSERRFASPASRMTGNMMDNRTGDTPRRGVRLVCVSLDTVANQGAK